jgi:class 3 adenylate cyclase
MSGLPALDMFPSTLIGANTSNIVQKLALLDRQLTAIGDKRFDASSILQLLQHVSRSRLHQLYKTAIGRDALYSLFEKGTQASAVISVDLRQSTQMMRNSRTPEAFVDFMDEFCRQMFSIIIKHNGVFEKFTGDGVIAFFSEKFTGVDFRVRALSCAFDLHIQFKTLKNKLRDCIEESPSSAGLGIGISDGEITILPLRSRLTAIGLPVVRACRYSSGQNGSVLGSYGLANEIQKFNPHPIIFAPVELQTKEGNFDVISFVDARPDIDKSVNMLNV